MCRRRIVQFSCFMCQGNYLNFKLNRMRTIFKTGSLYILFAFALFVSSCRKTEQQQRSVSVQSDVNLADASVALDWYKLQLRILLERNSAMNGVYFAYLGIGLYESVQPGIKNARSLSSVLYQMPQMPQTDNNGYNWGGV